MVCFPGSRCFHNKVKHNNYNLCRDLIDSDNSEEVYQANLDFVTE